jgi:hypothetical protein
MIWKFKRFTGRQIFVGVQGLLWILAASLFVLQQILDLSIVKVSSWLWLYADFLAAYTLGLTIRWGPRRFNKILAISIWGLFLAADWWEFPVFIYGGLGLFNGLYSTWSGTWVDQIHRVYVLFSLILFVYVTEPQIRKRTVALALFVGTVWPFLALLPGIPWGPTLARSGSLAAVGFILLKSMFPRLQSETGGPSRPGVSAAFSPGLAAQKPDFFPLGQTRRKGSAAWGSGLFIMAAFGEKPVGGCINYLQAQIIQEDRSGPDGQDPGPGTEKGGGSRKAAGETCQPDPQDDGSGRVDGLPE